jgi:glycosyltransferase involved in cell wall biosynthesis
MVYFTAPTSRESFGRVLAEGIAAGKVVITDPDTASIFGDAVVAARPDEVDAVVAAFVADPARYARHVARAQSRLAAFSAESFLRIHGPAAIPPAEAAA